MKKMIALLFAGALVLAMLAACGQNANDKASASASSQAVSSATRASASSSATASSSAGADDNATSLKNDPAEAEHQIQIAMQYQLEKAYGDKVNDARIHVKKIYSAEEEKADEILKSYNLGPDEVAFEIEYELHPADGVDAMEMTAATGQYDETTGWVVDKYNVGILRPNPDGEPAYIVTDFGTAF